MYNIYIYINVYKYHYINKHIFKHIMYDSVINWFNSGTTCDLHFQEELYRDTVEAWKAMKQVRHILFSSQGHHSHSPLQCQEAREQRKAAKAATETTLQHHGANIVNAAMNSKRHKADDDSSPGSKSSSSSRSSRDSDGLKGLLERIISRGGDLLGGASATPTALPAASVAAAAQPVHTALWRGEKLRNVTARFASAGVTGANGLSLGLSPRPSPCDVISCVSCFVLRLIMWRGFVHQLPYRLRRYLNCAFLYTIVQMISILFPVSPGEW